MFPLLVLSNAADTHHEKLPPLPKSNMLIPENYLPPTRPSLLPHKLLVPVPKARMIVPQILQLFLRQPKAIVPLASIPLLVLHAQTDHENRTGQATKPQEPETDAEAHGVGGRLGRDVDVARDDAATVAQADLQSGGDGALVVAAHGVAEPREGDGLRDVAADGDEVYGHVASADGDGLLGEEDHVADCGDADADDGECVAVAESIRAEGRE